MRPWLASSAVWAAVTAAAAAHVLLCDWARVEAAAPYAERSPGPHGVWGSMSAEHESPRGLAVVGVLAGLAAFLLATRPGRPATWWRAAAVLTAGAAVVVLAAGYLDWAGWARWSQVSAGGSPINYRVHYRPQAGPYAALLYGAALIAIGAGMAAAVAAPSLRKRRRAKAAFTAGEGPPPAPLVTRRRVLVAAGAAALAAGGAAWLRRRDGSRRTLTGHIAAVRCLAFDHDGQRLASIGADGTIKLWGLGTGRELVELRGAGEWATELRFSPDGRFLAVATADAEVELWDLERRGRHAALTTPVAVKVYPNDRHVAFTPDGRHLIAWPVGAVQDMRGRVWEVATGAAVRDLGGGGDRGDQFLGASRDGRVAALLNGGKVAFVEPLSARPLAAFVVGSMALPTYAAFNADATRAALRTGSGAAAFDLAGGRALADVVNPYADNVLLSRVELSPDGATLATLRSDDVRLWDAATGRPRAQVAGHDEFLHNLSFSPDGRLLVVPSYGYAGAVHLWDVATGGLVARLRGHSRAVECAAVTPDGQTVVTGGSDRTVKLWDVPAG